MKKNLLSFLSFITFVLVSLLIFITVLLPRIGVNVTGSLFNIIETIKDILLFIIIGISAYSFVATKKSGWKIFFVVMLVIFVVGIVLRLV